MRPDCHLDFPFPQADMTIRPAAKTDVTTANESYRVGETDSAALVKVVLMRLTGGRKTAMDFPVIDSAERG
jgi:hypothetical protein